MSIANKILTQICSAVEYLEDRGEMWEDNKTVNTTHVRYTGKIIDSMVVWRDGKNYEITIKRIV
jgi:hypothetical protein